MSLVEARLYQAGRRRGVLKQKINNTAASLRLRRAQARRLFLLALVLLLSPCLAQAAAPDSGRGLYAKLSAWAWAEPVSIDAYGDDWKDRLNRHGDDASAWIWAETGLRWGRWRFAVVTEQLVLGDATRQTAALYHRARNEQPFTVGERFRIDLDAQLLRMQGLRLGYAFRPAPGWNLELGLSVFDGFDLIDGTLRGEAEAVGAEDYTYRARLDYFYDQDSLFDRPTRAEDGFGASVDVILDGRWGGGWALDLRVHNLPGQVRWNHAPFTTGDIDSDTREFDDDGYVLFRPVLRGREGNRDFHQTLKPFGIASLGWDAPGAAIIPGLRLRANRLHQIPAVYAALPLGRAGRYGRLELESVIEPFALGLAWYGRYGEIRLSSDRTQYKDAHFLAIGLSLAIPF